MYLDNENPYAEVQKGFFRCECGMVADYPSIHVFVQWVDENGRLCMGNNREGRVRMWICPNCDSRHHWDNGVWV